VLLAAYLFIESVFEVETDVLPLAEEGDSGTVLVVGTVDADGAVLV
jgi:hypothetical protein